MAEVRKKRQPSDVEGPNAQKLRKAESGKTSAETSKKQSTERKEDPFKDIPDELRGRFKAFQDGGHKAIQGGNQ